MNELVYLNGNFIPRSSASISPDDRGFLFADGIYEVIKYYNDKPFGYTHHIQRLKRSLGQIDIEIDNIDGFEEIFRQLLERNNFKNTHAGIYLQITRGVYNRVHHFPADIKPTVYAFAFQLPSFTRNLEQGIKVITHPDIRWLRCDIKSVSLLPNTMLYNKAVESGAGECILIREGTVTEATHSSVLAVKNGTVVTHPLTNLILPGITRKVVLEICAANNIPVEERPVGEKELDDLDELMIVGTGSEITPVTEINNKPVANKKPGEVTRFLQQKFFELV
ncbi:MAG: D-amino-acid transaminase [Mariniphaga sp.]